MAREIFISYSRKDLEKVRVIKAEIEKTTGAECWMDLENVVSGAPQFTQDIVDGINGSRVFLFMLSKDSQNSKFALRELNFAMKKAEANKQKHVVIVNIDNCQMCDEFDFMYGLSDTITWRNKPQQEKLIRDIREWMPTANLQKVTNQETGDRASKKTENDANQNIEEVAQRKTEDEARRRIEEETKRKAEAKDRQKAEDTKLKPVKGLKKRFGIGYGEELYGYADETGKLVIPYQWKYAREFSKGFAVVSDGIRSWKIDRTGKTVPEPIQNTTNHMFGYINYTTGEMVTSFCWEVAQNFSEGLAAVCDSSKKYGYIDYTGNVVIPCRWKYAVPFCEGMARVQDVNGKWGFIDKHGENCISCQWKNVEVFSEGLARVQDENDKWGYINILGILVIPCKWDVHVPSIIHFPFSEGLAAVVDGQNKWGYIERTGEIVIPCKWEYASRFSGGLAIVRDVNDKIWKIDKTGKVVGECPKEDLSLY